MAETASAVTRLLHAWSAGEAGALERLVPRVYPELRRVARNHLRREARGQTLQPTALVNEIYLRLAEVSRLEWRDRAHFFALCSRLMRQILVDAARARRAAKRGGGAIRVTFDDRIDLSAPSDLLALDEALTALQEHDPRKSRVVELRFFGGLSLEEVAHVLDVSVGTVRRDWSLARAWLYRELGRRE